MMDLDLRMETAIEQLLAKIRSKSTAILRTRTYYDVPLLLSQFKPHVWSLIEYHRDAYFHTTQTLMQKMSRVQ